MAEGVEVPEGWRRLKLGEVAHSLKSGGTPSRDVLEFWGGNVPFVLIEDMTKTNKYLISTNETISEKGLKNSSAWIVPKYSILLSMYASLGEVVINKIDVATNQAILGIILKKDYNLEFMYYILRFNKRNYEKYTIQTTQKNLNKELVSQIFICIPISLPEQHKIAEILETVDNAIERTDTIIEKYKRIKQGLMQDLLTRGVVENDELGVMNYELRDEKKHKFKDSPLGRISEEWEVVELGEVVDIRLSNVDKKMYSNEVSVLLCNYLDVYQNDYITKSLDFMKGTANRKEIEKFVIKKGDVIITKDSEDYNDIAKSAFVKEDIDNLICGYHLALLKPKGTVDSLFLAKVLKVDCVNRFFQVRANGITRFGVAKETIETAKIPIPPLSEQHRIASVLSQMDQTIEKEQEYKQKLERIKQGLMEDLLTGKVRVNHLIKEGMENVQTA